MSVSVRGSRFKARHCYYTLYIVLIALAFDNYCSIINPSVYINTSINLFMCKCEEQSDVNFVRSAQKSKGQKIRTKIRVKGFCGSEFCKSMRWTRNVYFREVIIELIHLNVYKKYI